MFLNSILTEIDVAEATAADLTADAVLVPHAEVLPPCQYSSVCMYASLIGV